MEKKIIDDLKTLVEYAIDSASSMIGDNPKDDFMPLFIILTGSKEVHIIGTPFLAQTDEEATQIKNAVANVIRQKIIELRAIAYVHVSEAWITSHPIGTDLSTVLAPSKSDARKEVLVVVGRDQDGKAFMSHIDIDRSDDGGKVLGKRRDETDYEPVHGRFSNLFS